MQPAHPDTLLYRYGRSSLAASRSTVPAVPTEPSWNPDPPTLNQIVSPALTPNGPHHAVLVLLGDFRYIHPSPNRSLPWSPPCFVFSLLIYSQLVYDILRNTSGPCSCVGDPAQHDFFCSSAAKQIVLKIAKSSPGLPDPLTATIFNLSQVQQYSSGTSSPAHERNAFHLTISSQIHKITILAFDPEIIIHPDTYRSFVATQCFVDLDDLPSPNILPANYLFRIIGVVSDDYCSTIRVTKAIAKVAAGPNIYEIVHQALSTITQRWKPPLVVTIHHRKGLRSEKKSRGPHARGSATSTRRPRVLSAVSSMPHPVEPPASPLVAPTLPESLTPAPPREPPAFYRPAPISSHLPMPIKPISPIRIHRKRRTNVITPLRRFSKRRRILSPTPPPPRHPHHTVLPLSTPTPTAGPTNLPSPNPHTDSSDTDDLVPRHSLLPPPDAVGESPTGTFQSYNLWND